MTLNERTRPDVVADSRNANRVPVELKTIVQVKEGDGETWKEVTEVTTISRNGAGFSLARPCAVGRLITLVMPLDPELRAYDQNRDLYPVMGIVQHCNRSTVDGAIVYHVGVGFIGKDIPESFKADPTQNFRISGMSSDGLWKVTEVQSQFKNRKQPRYWVGLGVTVALLRRAANSGAKEESYTINIAAGGVSVACSLEATVGEKVKLACPAFNFHAIALVRNRKLRKNEMPTLHLQFVDAEFPIDKLIARISPAATS